jgi:hypothetical protein
MFGHVGAEQFGRNRAFLQESVSLGALLPGLIAALLPLTPLANAAIVVRKFLSTHQILG